MPVYLPNSAAVGERFARRHRLRTGAGGGQMIEPGKTVLVVDDDRAVREVALAVLETAGYRVIEAANGDDAYRLLLAHPDLLVDVLFTDVVMPGRLDGIDLANAARALRPGLQVLFATGFANLARDNRDSDMRGPVLRKPYRAGELCRAVVGLLERVRCGLAGVR